MMVSSNAAALVAVDNPSGVPLRLMANADVPIEPAAVAQARAFCAVNEALASPAFGGAAGLEQVLLTPDLHVGARLPVGLVADLRGAVLPEAIGADIGCGMRLLALELKPERLRGREADLERRLRAVFFGGKRDLSLRVEQRRALLSEGLLGLATCPPAQRGLWEVCDDASWEDEVARSHHGGCFGSEALFPPFARWLGDDRALPAYDGQIGSVGGGNHFVEIGTCDQVIDGPSAWEIGLRRSCVTVLVHSGSLGFGRAGPRFFVDAARDAHLITGPDRLAVLPTNGPHAPLAASYLSSMRQAAHFAFANRLALGLMTVRAISDVLGYVPRWQLIGDAPHNLIWPGETDDVWRHRKGATPAEGPGDPGPFACTGQPVLIPGSMGDRSHVLAGAGNPDCLRSASHGAGRALARGAAARTPAPELARLRIVRPVEERALIAAGRSDLIPDHQARLREEAPGAYKPIQPVVDSVTAAGAARPLATLAPLLTVKG